LPEQSAHEVTGTDSDFVIWCRDLTT